MADKPAASPPATVPIRRLGPDHRDAILAHLLALEPADRYLRFGYAAHDDQVRRYVERLDFERDELFGIFNRRLDLIAMAHLAYSVDPALRSCAEFGVSVTQRSRGRGYGSRLFERAVVRARNEGVSQLFIHALSENTAMLRIAHKAGAVIERCGAEAEAHLRLPPADFDSRVSEMIDQQVALSPTTTSRPRPGSSGGCSRCCRTSARACAMRATGPAADATGRCSGAAATGLGYPSPSFSTPRQHPWPTTLPVVGRSAACGFPTNADSCKNSPRSSTPGRPPRTT